MKFERGATVRAGKMGSRHVANLLAELDSAVAIIDLVDDDTFRRPTIGGGSIGAQFRHNLDIIHAFVKGIEIGRIDYNDRERDIRIEEERSAAVAQIQALVSVLTNLDRSSVLNEVTVRSEIDDRHWVQSSLGRELEFVHSHTVHHHALIAEKLAGFGIHVENDFGVAPSTLRYWEKRTA